MSRRVLIIVENLPVPFDRRVWQEANALKAAGYSVYVICPKGKGHRASNETIDGIEIFRHSLPFEAESIVGYIAEYSWALAMQFYLSIKIALTRGFDTVHACNPPDNIFLIGAFFKLFGKKFVFDHHDLCPELFEAKFGRKNAAYRLSVLLERLTFRLADVSIATNESYREIAIGRGRMRPDDVFVVRSGPDLKRVHAVPPDAELRKGRDYLVGYVGVMGKQEGLDILLRSIRVIVQELGRKDIQFALAGGGTELNSLIDYADELGIREFVTFTGRIPDNELLTLLSTAEVCVNPDRVNEMNDKSTMNKILEYMALSKPIVQFDLKEGRVSAGESSLYALANDERDFAAKIIELIDDRARREEMGAEGRARIAAELSWEHQSRRLLAAYARVGDLA